ncbi:hypothetical protein TWF506_005352 [Arthrobotrys conoides]|uniref:Uncharacterized protein n=1 Tax=Arthrobotrys conoides TaxID=74498 RepID=A0AAN8NTE4_9PEZI
MASIYSSHSSPSGEEHSASKSAPFINKPFEQTTPLRGTFEKATSHENLFEPAPSLKKPFESPDNTIDMGGVTSQLLPNLSGLGSGSENNASNFDHAPELGELRIPDRQRFPRRKSKAQKARDLKNAVNEDYNDDWLTEPESDDENPGNGDKSGSSKARRAASRRLAALNSRRRIFKEDLKERENMPVLPEEEDRFIDRSFRHGLQDSIKGWKDVRFFTTEEATADLRLNHAFSGQRGPPRGSRTEYQGPPTVDRPDRMGKPNAATWPEIKELLQKRGKDTKLFEERGKAEEERLIRLLRLHEEGRHAKRTGAKHDDFGDKMRCHGDDDDDEDDEDEDNHKYLGDESSDEEDREREEEMPRPNMTLWDYANPFNWSFEWVPLWVQNYIIWARQIERIYDDDTDWCQIIFLMVSFWLGGIFTLLMVWVMSRAMMATGQWSMDEPGHPVPI